MKAYIHSGNIKGGLFLVGIALITTLILFSQKIVNNLRAEHREIVRLYSELIASATEQSDENLNFIFENIIRKIQFPVIQSDRDNQPQFFRNLPKEHYENEELIKILHSMDSQNEPIPLVFRDKTDNTEFVFGYLHFSDSRLIQRLQWLPYIEIGAVALFILFGFIGFSVIRNSEKHYLWVGLARETAHQLGTPVSALMGWLDWLKEHPQKIESILPEMASDIKRLDQISERFSKMGSKPDLVEVNLAQTLAGVIGYLEHRLPSFNKDVTILHEIDPALVVPANETLISWAFENVIRNGIDSIEHGKGRITVTTLQEKQSVKLLFQDTGRGILRKHWKNIFRPGFSTKKYGWGLGLSLTQRIIKDIHRGEIGVMESSAENGTKIFISLPR